MNWYVANDHTKGNLTEEFILHAFTLLPALQIQCFYWLTVRQSKSVWGSPSGLLQKSLFLFCMTTSQRIFALSNEWSYMYPLILNNPTMMAHILYKWHSVEKLSFDRQFCTLTIWTCDSYLIWSGCSISQPFIFCFLSVKYLANEWKCCCHINLLKKKKRRRSVSRWVE